MKYWRISKFISFLLVFALTSTLLPFTNIDSEEVANAASFSHGAINDYQVISKIGETEGTESNPLVILEIVPDESFAEIGYTIAGCEPVDIKRLESDDRIKKIAEFGSAEVSPNKTEVTKFKLDTGDIGWTYVDDEVITLPGYYQRVAEGRGEFKQDNRVTDDTTDPVTVEVTYPADSAGNFIWVTDDTPIDAIPAQEKDSNAPNVGDKIYTNRTDHYYKKDRYKYKNKNLFLKSVIGLTTDTEIENYHVVVKTITPYNLSYHAGDINWIDQADLIYINSKSHSTDMVNLWKNFKCFGNSTDTNATFNTNDLSWEATIKILERVLGIGTSGRAALILDKRIGSDLSTYTKTKSVSTHQITYDGTRSEHSNTSSTAYINNMYKLFLMTQLMDARIFYNLFLSDHDGTTTPFVSQVYEDGKTTGSRTIKDGADDSIKEVESYWNPYTFLMCTRDNKQADDSYWSSAQMWDDYRLDYKLEAVENLNGYIYAYDGTNSLAAALSSTIKVEASSEPKHTSVLVTYLSRSGTYINRTGLAIRYILSNEGMYTGIENNLNVLELQPCADFTLKEFRIRMMVPRFIGKVSITRQSTAEFNGKIEDLNSKYHMIYIGMNFGKFTTGPVENNHGVIETLPIYNDTDQEIDATVTADTKKVLDGKIYLHVGDRLKTTEYNEIAPTNRVRLPGNDITELKKKDLIEYLAGGYPVVVKDIMYQCDADDAVAADAQFYIDKTSQIYDFISTNKGAYRNIINESSTDINGKLLPHIQEYKPKINLKIHPKEYNGASSDGSIPDDAYINDSSNPSNRTLLFKFTIEDGPQEELYEVKLYIDSNADGRYDEAVDSDDYNEVVKEDDYVSDNSDQILKKTLPSTYVGVIPWKFEITNKANKNKRAEVTGICAVKRPSADRIPIKILQVRDNRNDPTLNLEENIRTHGNFDKYTKNLSDFKIQCVTITVSEFESWYSTEAFDINNPTATDKLRQESPYVFPRDINKRGPYDMIIFGFRDYYNNISNTNKALDNVKYYIEKGYPVMFTHDVTSYNNDDTGDQFGKNFNLTMRAALCMDRFGVREALAPVTNKDYCKSPSGVEYTENQGFTYSAIYRMMNTGDNAVPIYKGLNYADEPSFKTKKVSKINDGQLTQYPYKIAGGSNTFDVAETHSQYYQLNLNDDDLVVWYTLAGDNPLYSSSPNDAANNYYIYSKGNVIYTGVGHSNVNSSDEEVKLFVNTMVAAYKNANQPPTVSITNENTSLGSDSKYYTYINSDTEVATGSGGTIESEFDTSEVMEIKFEPIEFNFFSGELGVKVGPVSGGAFYDIYRYDERTGAKIKVTEKYREDDVYIKLTSDKEYFIEYKKSDFNSLNTAEFKFEVIDSKGTTNSVNLKLLRRSLFRLN